METACRLLKTAIFFPALFICPPPWDCLCSNRLTFFRWANAVIAPQKIFVLMQLKFCMHSTAFIHTARIRVKAYVFCTQICSLFP